MLEDLNNGWRESNPDEQAAMATALAAAAAAAGGTGGGGGCSQSMAGSSSSPSSSSSTADNNNLSSSSSSSLTDSHHHHHHHQHHHHHHHLSNQHSSPSTSLLPGAAVEQHQQQQQSTADDGDLELQPVEPSENLEQTVCAACEQPVRDRFVLRVLDASYHAQCVRCADCGQTLHSKCFARQRQLLCRTHFYRRYGQQCSTCEHGIEPETCVRRAAHHIYHVNCFACVVCRRELQTGEQFYLVPGDGRLVCKVDYDAAKNREAENENSNKRPRTTISAKSLETLKQAYQTSCKPARHVREQLAAETGLDMRVVQVWFQNRRAKEKRLKKDAGRRWSEQKTGGQTMGGGHAMDTIRPARSDSEPSTDACDSVLLQHRQSPSAFQQSISDSGGGRIDTPSDCGTALDHEHGGGFHMSGVDSFPNNSLLSSTPYCNL